jgi:hypothetical protein
LAGTETPQSFGPFAQGYLDCSRAAETNQMDGIADHRNRLQKLASIMPREKRSRLQLDGEYGPPGATFPLVPRSNIRGAEDQSGLRKKVLDPPVKIAPGKARAAHDGH